MVSKLTTKKLAMNKAGGGRRADREGANHGEERLTHQDSVYQG